MVDDVVAHVRNKTSATMFTKENNIPSHKIMLFLFAWYLIVPNSKKDAT